MLSRGCHIIGVLALLATGWTSADDVGKPHIPATRDVESGTIPRRDEILRHGSAEEQLAALEQLTRGALWAPSTLVALRALLDAPSMEVSRAAASALAAIGARAKPLLLEAAKSTDGATRRLAVEALGEKAVRAIEWRDVEVALESALLDRDWLVRRSAAASLCKLWPASCDALTRAMKRGDAAAKEAVIEALLTPSSPIVEHIHDCDVYINGHPFLDASRMPIMFDFADEVGPELEANAHAGEHQREALLALREIPVSVERRENLPTLSESLARRIIWARDIESIVPGSTKNALDGVIAGAEGADPEVQWLCVHFFADHPDWASDPAAAARMVQAMLSPDNVVRDEALRWAATLNRPVNGLVAALAANVLPGSPFGTAANSDRVLAAKLLGLFASEPAASVEVLRRALDDPLKEMQAAAVVSLGAFGDAAAPAVPRLTEFFKTNANLQDAAAQSLAAINTDGRKVVAAYFVERLGYAADHDTRAAQLTAIAHIGPDAAAATDRLVKILAGDDTDLRIRAAGALGEIGQAAAPAIAPLTRMVDNSQPAVREAAARALAKISPDGRGIAPALMSAVYNADVPCTDRLAALVRRGGTSEAFMRRLNDIAQDDPEVAVRHTARRAVELLVGAPVLK